MSDWKLPPEEIERRSFRIIDSESPPHEWPPDQWSIVRRMVHTSADFDYVRNVRIHPGFIQAGVAAIRQGRPLVTDTRMVQAGISSRRLEPFGVRVECLIDHADVSRIARDLNITRAAAAVDHLVEQGRVGLYVVGNAPTALFRVLEHIAAGRQFADAVIGLPVGFVNAAEAKDALLACSRPYLTALGRKGGSNVAAAVVNALAVLAAQVDEPAG